MAIVRVTLFKIPSKENQKKFLDLYPTLAKTAVKVLFLAFPPANSLFWHLVDSRH